MTRQELWEVMINKIRITLVDRAKHTAHIGYITAIQLEDGSGYCFNVKMSDGATIFVRCSKPHYLA